MIKELINFTNNLDDNFKNLAYKPSKGLHITVDIDKNGNVFIDNYFYYNGDDEIVEQSQIQVLYYEKYSSYISMNQQQKFDKKQKIHSASPFSFAFNFSLGNNKKDIEIDLKQKMVKKELDVSLDMATKYYKIEEVKKCIANYFINAKKLCFEEFPQNLKNYSSKFELFCSDMLFEALPKMTMKKNISKKKDIEIIEDVSILGELKEKDYVRVYLKAVGDDFWKSAYEYYYDKEYPPNELNDSDFINNYPDKKPFKIHRTAPFETNIRINGKETKILQNFKDILGTKPKILPNPLPVFIFKEELQKEVIALFKESGFKISYKETIEKLWDSHKTDFNNYYLINWFVGKEIVFQDFDFVSKFDYEFDAQIENLFEIKEKGTKNLIHYPKINNVFELEQKVFLPLIQNKYLKLDYFGDLDKEAYEKLDNTFICFSKYRKAIYDFVYKSKRQGIDINIFSDMVFSHIKDDIKQKREYSIKEKLNIWFSLYEKFNSNNQNNTQSMESKLKIYQDFVAQLATGTNDDPNANDEKFAFASGQVINYILQKSKSSDQSYQLLEPYLQQSKCTEFKKAIANDFARYKHENFSRRFEYVAAFVLSYSTETNMRGLMPEILAGVFAKNQLFSENKNN